MREKDCVNFQMHAQCAAQWRIIYRHEHTVGICSILFSLFICRTKCCMQQWKNVQQNKKSIFICVCNWLKPWNTVYILKFKRDTPNTAHRTKIIPNAHICIDYFFTPCASGFCLYDHNISDQQQHQQQQLEPYLIQLVRWSLLYGGWYINCNLDLIHRHHYLRMYNRHHHHQQQQPNSIWLAHVFI